jgi:hypothetical protein
MRLMRDVSASEALSIRRLVIMDLKGTLKNY